MKSVGSKEKSKTRVTLAGPDDAISIARMCQELREYELSLLPKWAKRIQEHWEKGATPEKIARMIADPSRVVLIAKDPDGGATGFLSARVTVAQDGFKEGEIETIFVKKDHRKKGVGTLLLKEAETRLKEKGCSAASVIVYSNNSKARQFYLSRGYSPLIESFKKNL